MAPRQMIPDTASELSGVLDSSYWTHAEELVAAITEPEIKQAVADRLGVTID